MAPEVHTEGLQFILETAFSEVQSVPANFFIGLCTDASLAETASLGDQTELSGNDYARQEVPSSAAGFTSASTGTNDRKLTTSTETFTASGGAWSGAVTAFLATTVNDTGKLIASAPLSATRTLQDGDSLQVSFVITAAG